VVAADQQTGAEVAAAHGEDVDQRGAGGRLDDRRGGGGSADGEHHGARLRRHADRVVLPRPQPGRDGELAVRLRVGQQRGQAVDAVVAGPDLAAGRYVRLAVDAAHQRAALAGDEPVRHGDDPGRRRHPAFGQRGGQRPLADPVVGDADDDLLGVQRGRGKRRAVQHQVRAAGQDRLVLPGRRLALGRVDHDDRRQVLPAAGVEHRAHLAGEREPGAAASAQVDAVGQADQLPRGQRREAAVHLLVGDQVQTAVLVEPGGDPRRADAGDRRDLVSAHAVTPPGRMWMACCVIAPLP
jgi:hypothetical protein